MNIGLIGMLLKTSHHNKGIKDYYYYIVIKIYYKQNSKLIGKLKCTSSK